MDLNFKGTRLLVRNYQACVEFYQEKLGFELIYQDSQGEETDLKMGDTRLNIIKRESMATIIGSAEESTSAVSSDNVALIFITKDLDETFAQLKEKDISSITPPTYRPQWGIKTIYLRDPDENLIGIYQMTDYTNM